MTCSPSPDRADTKSIWTCAQSNTRTTLRSASVPRVARGPGPGSGRIGQGHSTAPERNLQRGSLPQLPTQGLLDLEGGRPVVGLGLQVLLLGLDELPLREDQIDQGGGPVLGLNL